MGGFGERASVRRGAMATPTGFILAYVGGALMLDTIASLCEIGVFVLIAAWFLLEKPWRHRG